MLPLLLLLSFGVALDPAGERPRPGPDDGLDKEPRTPRPERKLTVEKVSGLTPEAAQHVQARGPAFQGCARAATVTEPRGQWQLEVRPSSDGGAAPTVALMGSKWPATAAQRCAVAVVTGASQLAASVPGIVVLKYASSEPEPPTTAELDAAREEARGSAREAVCLAAAAKNLEQVVASIRATKGGDRRALAERLAKARNQIGLCGAILRGLQGTGTQANPLSPFERSGPLQ